MRTKINILVIYFSAFLCGMVGVNAQSGAELFSRYCVACHTIGNGDLIGPDLKGITEKRDKGWLISFIQSSQTLINKGDPEAVKVFEKYNKIPMPDQPVNKSEVENILEYISGQSSPDPGIQKTSKTNIPAKNERLQYDNTDLNAGLALFKGIRKFENGGVSCISCHTIKHDAIIAGGTLARNLTESFDKMGVPGIKAVLLNPPFPEMNASYETHPLTEKEVHALTAFLVDSSKQAIYQHPREYTKYFVLVGVFIWLILIGIIALIWVKRKRGSVNDAIYDRQIEIY